MPILFPVGDDHVRLATWLPECGRGAAAEAARRRGAHRRLSRSPRRTIGTPTHIVRGEMRSPAFSPVLAGVASARIREKQAAFARDDAAASLRRAAHDDGAPRRRLAARRRASWCGARGSSSSTTRRTTRRPAAASTRRTRTSRRAIAGPSSWRRRRAIRRWRSCASTRRPARRATWSRSTPGRACRRCWWRRRCRWRSSRRAWRRADPTGSMRPIQVLGGAENRPIFEGEFPAAELAQYLGGVDPKTPLFGKYLQGITATETSPGTVRLDVGLGDAAVDARVARRRSAARRAAAQEGGALQGGHALRRPVAAGAGAGRAGAGAVAGADRLRRRQGGGGSAGGARARRRRDPGLACGALTVRALQRRLHRDHTTPTPSSRVRANELVDDGDRGDLYHCDPLDAAGAPEAGERDGHRGGPAARAHRHRAAARRALRGCRPIASAAPPSRARRR